MGKILLPAMIFVFILNCWIQPQEALGQHQRLTNVPLRYKSLYGELERKLQEIDQSIRKRWDGQKYPTAFSVELLAANSHRGEALLRDETFKANVMMLDRLQSLGVEGITLGILYPVLNPSFPRSADYLTFYKRLAFEIRQRDLKLVVETTSTFREPEFSDVKVDYSGLTFDRYKREKRQMVETILREIRPDFLTVESEPLTQQRNTGVRYSVRNYTKMIQYILKDLDRSGAKMGAGAGTWDDFDYFESMARRTTVDYIDMHIYPIQRDFLIDRGLRIEKLARAHNKMVTVGEAWLYKAAEKEFAGLEASQPIIFARDVYDFWIPLDEKFLEVMVKLSHYLKLEFLSFFWMRYLYGYLEYTKMTKGLSPLQLFRLVNGVSYKNLVMDRPSRTGLTFQKLIKEKD